MKNIGLDSLPILANFSQGTGISKYITRLAKGFLSLDRESTYIFYARRAVKKFRRELLAMAGFRHPHLVVRPLWVPDRLLNLLSALPQSSLAEALFFRDIDIFISTCYFTPWLKKAKVISFIYDLSPLVVSTFPSDYRKKFTKLIEATIARSSLLLTISENSKRDLIDHFRLNPGQIEVIYPAAEDDFRPLGAEEAGPVLRRCGIDSEYILYVGIRGKHKNVTTLVRVFAALKKEFKIPHKLVLCGRRDTSSDETEKEIQEIIRSSRLEKEIITPGYVDDRDLPALYSGASVFVFLSLYEGFGVPPLEAMACGTPVVVSAASSLPEVVGQAGMTVNPKDEAQILSAIVKVLRSQEVRQAMKEQSLVQSKKFSLEKSAEKFLHLVKGLP